MKKIINIVLSIFTLLQLILPVAVQGNEVLSVGRVSVAMPQIIAEIRGTGYAQNDITATLATDVLAVEEVEFYDSATHTTCAYVLVDLSTSMRRTFELVKRNIVTYINSMGSNDKLVLITFGETEITTALSGDEEREDAIEVVEALECNENGTLFYEALSQVYQQSTASVSTFDREYVIAFSDGIDYQKGNTTFDEVLALYDSHALPLYAACSYNASQSASDQFGKIARASGGSIIMNKNDHSFDELLNDTKDVTIIRLKAASNYADGMERQLSVKIGNSQVECNIPITRSLADEVPPTVEKLYYDADKNMFIISYSEPVLGAASVSAYKVTNPDGKRVDISNVYYSESENYYEIQPKDVVYNGTYTIELSGITDNSQEANSIVGKQTVLVENAKISVDTPKDSDWNSDAEAFPVFGIVLIAVGGVVVVLVIVLVVVLSSRNKENGEKNSEIEIPVKATPEVVDYMRGNPDAVKHHIKANDAIRIRLKIKTGKTSEQNIETSLVSSLIVGRSDTCDIYIDDTKLSRQHFVIENDNGDFYIMDLQSRNGTMLNGIRINSRQRLNSGDKILAGLSDIIITVIGR